MRILHIGKYYAPFKGGVETYLQDALKSLAARGYDCQALVHNHAAGLQARYEDHGAGAAQWRIVRSATWITAFFTPLSPGFRGDLVRLIRTFHPEVIHVHLPNPSACWLLTLRSARQIPLVVHWHADVLTDQQGPLMRLLYRLYRPCERRLLRRAGAIIATSRPYLESSEALRDHQDKCHVVPLGLDPDRLNGIEAPAARAKGTRFQVLAVGRLTYYKGFDILIRAMADLPHTELTLIGQGSLDRELAGLARQMGVAERVHFLGGVDDQGLREQLNRCDCVCLPSIERTEAFGLVLLEAMAAARPTVVSRVSGSGMTWVVEDGVTGLHTAPGDPQALAAALETLRNDPERAHSMGRAGRLRFDKLFSIDPSVDSLVAVYERVTAPGAAL